MFLTDSADIIRINYSSKLNRKQRSELGQFLTPATIARFMATQFNTLSGHICLLDPGAGVGALTAAVVEQLLTNPEPVHSFSVTAYEIDPVLLPKLEQSLIDCCKALEYNKIQANYTIHSENFIIANHGIHLPLFSPSPSTFTHAILNPPYKKIYRQSVEKKILNSIGVDTVNLYSAFVWLATLRLKENGEMVAITPRSFCNGTYFRPFRRYFLESMKLDRIHVFDSRSDTFSEDKVLQENIIFHASKSQEKSTNIKITSNAGNTEIIATSNGGSDKISEFRFASYDEVVEPDDEERFIHITTNILESHLRTQMNKLPSYLNDIGLQVSTGPVVDFRMKTALNKDLKNNNIPLIYPETITSGKVVYPPPNPRKAIAIERNKTTEKWLTKSGWYVLTKRFSAKEEKRRVVAVACPPVENQYIGIENHLNYYHAHGGGIEPALARGLATFLNSTLFDQYFRQFSGHTQVNATDLRRVKYPCKDDLIQIGVKIGDRNLNQTEIDKIVHDTLLIMSEVNNAVEAKKRIEESLAILKAVSAPKGQQNERSALCLLALADIQPDNDWSQATAPMRGITDMMDWFREHYGKQYAPNTRETVRRQTMHQFVQMGLVVINPDQPKRPVTSPKTCYQLHKQTLSLIQVYGSKQWEDALKTYGNLVTNLLQEKTRSIPTIPVRLPNGQAIQLSSGGQNSLIKDILESFCPRFTPGGIVLYIGDARKKFIINETRKFQELGIELDPHGKMPDIVVFHKRENWLILVEAVTIHGPVDLKRRNELRQLFQASNKGLVFVTAFPSRREMTRYLAEISWETEVWVANQPDHMIHFNGERFLGPYEDPNNE